MSILKRFLIICFLLALLASCNQEKEYLLKSDFNSNENSRFFKDFNIFSRKGVDEVLGDTLRLPFFQVNDRTDSSILLTVFKRDYQRELLIPKDEKLIYTFFDIADGPKHNYYKIFQDRIVVYGYDNKIDDIQNWIGDSVSMDELLPADVTIMTGDTIFTFFSNCFEQHLIRIAKTDYIKYAVLPFSKKLDINCKNSLVHYFDSAGHLRHYYRSTESGEYLSREKPGDGLYGYKREFKYWREYYPIFPR